MAQASKRFYDIDAVRTYAMFAVVLIHTSRVYGPYDTARTNNPDRHPFFDWLSEGLDLFATPTFFVVSGFFALSVLAKDGLWKMLVKRVTRLGVPLLVTALTFNLLESYYRYRDSLPGQSEPMRLLDYVVSPVYLDLWPDFSWALHLWFLTQLVGCFLLLIGLAALVRTAGFDAGLPARIMDRLSNALFAGPLAGLRMALILAVLQVGFLTGLKIVPGLYDNLVVGPVGFMSLYSLMFSFFFFSVGMALFSSPGLYKAAFRWEWTMIPLGAAAFYFQFYPRHYDLGGWQGILLFAAHMAARWILILLMLKFFHRFFNNRPSPLTQFFAGTAMTVYLVHHLVVYMLGDLLIGLAWPMGIEWGLLSVLTVAVCAFLHWAVVGRFRLLMFLLNGQPLRVSKPAGRPAPETTGS